MVPHARHVSAATAVVALAGVPVASADFWQSLFHLQNQASTQSAAQLNRFCGIATHASPENGFNEAELGALASRVGAQSLWHYNWAPSSPVHAAGVEYVPMIKYPGNSPAGAGAVAYLPQANTQGTSTLVKGWNEPDDPFQAGSVQNLRWNPEGYAQQWTSDMNAARAKGYTEFVAPAIAHDTIWLDYFLKGCEATAGCRDTITYLAFHRYRPDCAGYVADPNSFGWRDDLSYLLTMQRLMTKYNERGFNIRGLVMDELGCVTADWAGFAPEWEQVRYLNEFYRDTIVAVRVGDTKVIEKVKATPWIMPKGPDAHSGLNYQQANAQQRALDAGPLAGADAVRAMQSLVAVAWFSQAPGTNYLPAPNAPGGISWVGRAYLDACRLLQLPPSQALAELQRARQTSDKAAAAAAAANPTPPLLPPLAGAVPGTGAALAPPPPSLEGWAPMRGGSDFPRFCGVATHSDAFNGFSAEDLQEMAAEVGAVNLWHYNWAPTSRVHTKGVEYVPMIKFPGDSDMGAEDIAKLPDANTQGTGNVVKGWNEPDDQGEAGRIAALRTDPESFAKQWTADMQAAHAKGYTEFIGPAIAHDTIWYDFFLKGCEATEGCKDTITYLAFHRYRPDCAEYKALPDAMAWRDDLSYLLTMERLKDKYNKRGFKIRGLVMDELGCFRSDWSGYAPEPEQVQYVNAFYRDTIVAVKIGDAAVIEKVKTTPWIMPKGPDAHDGGLNYTTAIAQQKALDGGATAGADTVRAIEDLVSVAWFSQSPGANYLPQIGPAAGLSLLGKSYFDACKLVNMPPAQALAAMTLAQQGVLPPPPPPPPPQAAAPPPPQAATPQAAAAQAAAPPVATPRIAAARTLQNDAVRVRVVSHVCPSAACPYETHALSLFVTSEQVVLGCNSNDNSYSFMYNPSTTQAWTGFGLQENGWYWRGPGAKPAEQNPDNAGMQVFLNAADCSVRTGPSIAGGAVPDARGLLGVSGARSADGSCEVTVTRLPKPTLCVAGAGAKQCCPPCSVKMFSRATCCSKDADGSHMTCEDQAPVPRVFSV